MKKALFILMILLTVSITAQERERGKHKGEKMERFTQFFVPRQNIIQVSNRRSIVRLLGLVRSIIIIFRYSIQIDFF